jgi:hypothetical protein
MPGYLETAKNAGWIYGLVCYAVYAISLFMAGNKANIKNVWVAFIPFVQLVALLHIIDKSGWNIFLLFIPIVNIIFSIIWIVKFYRAFSVHPALIVVSIIIPIVGIVMMLVIAFSSAYEYSG